MNKKVIILLVTIFLIVLIGCLAYISIKSYKEKGISKVDISVTLEVSYADVSTNLADECDQSNDIVDHTLEVLRRRLDLYDECKYTIQRLQGNRIQVELTGVKASYPYSANYVIDLLRTSGKLEFWKVYNDDDMVNEKSIIQRFYEADVQLDKEMHAKLSAEYGFADTEEESEDDDCLGAIMSKSVAESDGLVIGFFKEMDIDGINSMLPELQRILDDQSVAFYWGIPDKHNNNAIPLIPLKRKNASIGPELSSETVIDGHVVRSAKQKEYKDGLVVVAVSMEDPAAAEWRKITREAAEDNSKITYIAIVLDNVVYSYPRICGEISNGRAEISGNYTIEGAKVIATVLNSGTLDAKVEVVKYDEKPHVE